MLLTTTQFRVRPDRTRAFERGVRRVVERAEAEQETRCWYTRRVRAGSINKYYLSLPTPEWASQGAIAPIDRFIEHLFGEEEGSRIVDELWECLESAYRSVAELRTDLSVPEDGRDDFEAPIAMLTRFSPTPAGWEDCERLYAHLREAIGKLDDRRRYGVYQTRIGDLTELWESVPLDDLSQLDGWRTREELLEQAFGPQRGREIHRAFLRGMQSAERELGHLRPDLSHVP